MGLFGKKEKTPEKKLVDEIWQEIKLILSVTKEKVELIGIIEAACNNGASCDEIQRVYEENLPKYQKKPDAEIERIRAADSKPLPLREKLIGFGILAFIVIIVAGIAYLISALGSDEIRYDEVMVGGLEFNVPQGYNLVDSGEDSFSAYQKYEDKVRAGNRKRRRTDTTYYFDLYVFKNKTVDQALVYLDFDDGWEIHRDINYGKYTGVRADIIVWPFRNTVPQWFIFEKGGKSVAVFLDNQAIFKNGIATIIS